MSPNISASKSPLRNCVRSSRDGQFSSQPNTTERGTASLRYPIIKQQQATNAEMIINLKTAKMLSITLKPVHCSAAGDQTTDEQRLHRCSLLAFSDPSYQADDVPSPR